MIAGQMPILASKINNSDVVAATASKSANPAICADGNIEIIDYGSSWRNLYQSWTDRVAWCSEQ